MTSFEFLEEEWIDQFDFCYFDQVHYHDWTTNISSYYVSPATKAKFRFPAKDPIDNLILDKRSDSQKVTDILRIWSQLLTTEEQEIWNEIAERSLSHDISLESGVRTPKSFIENEIKAFINIKQKDQSALLRTLRTVPDISRPSPIPQPTGESSPLENLPGGTQS